MTGDHLLFSRCGRQRAPRQSCCSQCQIVTATRSPNVNQLAIPVPRLNVCRICIRLERLCVHIFTAGPITHARGFPRLAAVRAQKPERVFVLNHTERHSYWCGVWTRSSLGSFLRISLPFSFNIRSVAICASWQWVKNVSTSVFTSTCRSACSATSGIRLFINISLRTAGPLVRHIGHFET